MSKPRDSLAEMIQGRSQPGWRLLGPDEGEARPGRKHYGERTYLPRSSIRQEGGRRGQLCLCGLIVNDLLIGEVVSELLLLLLDGFPGLLQLPLDLGRLRRFGERNDNLLCLAQTLLDVPHQRDVVHRHVHVEHPTSSDVLTNIEVHVE